MVPGSASGAAEQEAADGDDCHDGQDHVEQGPTCWLDPADGAGCAASAGTELGQAQAGRVAPAGRWRRTGDER